MNLTVIDVMDLQDEAGITTHYNFTTEDPAVNVHEIIIAAEIVNQAVSSIDHLCPVGLPTKHFLIYPAYTQAVFVKCLELNEVYKDINILEERIHETFEDNKIEFSGIESSGLVLMSRSIITMMCMVLLFSILNMFQWL